MTDIGAILDSYFRGTAPPAAWYVGLVDGATFTAFDPVTDTMPSHPGWTEVTAYAEATRQQWVPGVVLDGYPATLNNPGNAIVNPTADGSAIGIFLCSVATKGGTTGQLVGPFFFENGVKNLVTAAPFSINMNITLKRNTPSG